MSDELVAAAVQEGKIPPARAKHYRDLMRWDPEGTAELLATLAPVLPVGEQGVAVLPDEGRLSARGGSSDYPKEWLGDHQPPSGRIIEAND